MQGCIKRKRGRTHLGHTLNDPRQRQSFPYLLPSQRSLIQFHRLYLSHPVTDAHDMGPRGRGICPTQVVGQATKSSVKSDDCITLLHGGKWWIQECGGESVSILIDERRNCKLSLHWCMRASTYRHRSRGMKPPTESLQVIACYDLSKMMRKELEWWKRAIELVEVCLLLVVDRHWA